MVIRQPSTSAQLYAWHRAAIAGENPATHDGLPECGWFKTKLVTGGPWVAAIIKIERDIDPETGELTAPERMVCLCDGQRRNPARMWTFLRAIPREEYQALILRREAIPEMAATMAKIDLSQMEPVTP